MSDEIFRPIFPPKDGYVEVLDENGEHVYKPTKETLEKKRNFQFSEEIYEILHILLGG